MFPKSETNRPTHRHLFLHIRISYGLAIPHAQPSRKNKMQEPNLSGNPPPQTKEGATYCKCKQRGKR